MAYSNSGTRNPEPRTHLIGGTRDPRPGTLQVRAETLILHRTLDPGP